MIKAVVTNVIRWGEVDDAWEELLSFSSSSPGCGRGGHPVFFGEAEMRPSTSLIIKVHSTIKNKLKCIISFLLSINQIE